ncbi:LLM class flavin-dependent oxidoreductase [Roseivirga pacifica]|uniref:LLM class flavin-dependent oxidoreductase n=1 Tax=Roseivirga pacifica TaxID=1267423 RepID=UPI002094D074|nr:LLM class flavin-dependent oxidoreductase [Roseivirga pacifica]MCO6358065.1 MsnO8 family LLM class oxidoreductase [Roseivirga pacifica]MCO6366503.1 MsnO8 family LLM class oxidoreductase [Roseivirga pacifica]MCO6370988.1 MsnO8 family LLM class oxidoreductase [Roseivirga pacifica]MCO6373796.1 MsnO8 family LLM class oxidoreductase [Roseivirga pacifica]MCO6380777.1 MsnO8 family LLM class oxidoreductase [Roseivirga pacifica]
MPQKNIPYSILELASVAANSNPADTFKRSLDLAQKAEELGYHRFWLAEHHNMISIASSATAVLIGHIAAGTEKIRVGSGGIMLPNHSPLVVSEQFGTLGSLYPDRIDLGLGRAPGTDQVTAQAIRSDRMQSVYRFPEEVEAIQQYFSADNAGARVRSTVAEGVNVPIYILGSSTDSAHLAAKMGLPYAFASHFAPAQLFEALNIYYNEFQPSDYLSEPYTIGLLNIIAADTDAEAERLSTTQIRMILGVLTNKLDYMQPPIDMTPELKAISQDPAFLRMQQYAFVGSKATVKEKTEEFLSKTGVSELMIASHLYHHEDRLKSIELFSEVMKER